MFDKLKNNNNNPISLGKTNRIAEETIVNGNISSKTDFRIDGQVVGNIFSEGKLVIGANGAVQGDIKCKNIDIEGKFLGKLEAQEMLSLKATAHIKGEVVVGKLAVEPGARFEASCIMKNPTSAENKIESTKNA